MSNGDVCELRVYAVCERLNGLEQHTIPMECAIVSYCRHADRASSIYYAVCVRLFDELCVCEYSCAECWHIENRSSSKMDHKTEINRFAVYDGSAKNWIIFVAFVRFLWVNVIVHRMKWIYHHWHIWFSSGLRLLLLLFARHRCRLNGGRWTRSPNTNK